METTARGNSRLPSGSSINTGGNSSKASPGAHTAVNSIAAATAEAARKARPVIDRASAMAHQAADTAADVVAPAADWVTGHGERLHATQNKLMADACRYIAAHPLKAIGIAAAAGFLLSRLIR